MANFAPEVTLRFCRFCLSEDENILIPVESTLDDDLSLEDIAKFTGIQITDDQKAVYSVCLECTNTLKLSATFRNTCVQNDPHFHDMCTVLASTIQKADEATLEFLDNEFEMDVGYVESDYDAATEYLESDDSMDLISYDGFDDTASLISSKAVAPSAAKRKATANSDAHIWPQPVWYRTPGNSVVSSTIDKEERTNVPERCPAVSASRTNHIYSNGDVPELRNQPNGMVSSTNQEVESDDELFSYSANYIPAGEILHVEDATHQTCVDWHASLNPTPYPIQPYHKRTSGRRLTHLCNICGLLVGHLETHLTTHDDTEQGYSCPYCPVKTKQKKNLGQHIDAVHNKISNKTCQICGKGFVHPKTYRYHMETHEAEGQTFECPDCAKRFISAMYLRDHINRVHSVATRRKGSAPKGAEVLPVKRSRLQIQAE